MTSAIEGASILVVDDSALNRRVVRAILESAGARVREAASGELGLESARADAVDLVLLDVMLPGMDGLAVCAALKSDPRTADVPVIVVSSLGESADRVRGLRAGAEDYVTKPFDREEVVARVATQMRIRRLTRSLRDLNRGLTERQDRIDEDLRAAAAIQRTLLPRAGAAAPRLAFEWLFEPSAAIGGDLFQVVPLGGERTGIYLFDVSGHGVPAALVALSVSQCLAPAGGLVLDRDGEPAGPARVLAALEKEFPFERFEKFFSMVYLTFDAASGGLRHASAGHPAPLLLSPGEPVRPLGEGGPIVGIGHGATFEEGARTLRSGDRLVLCTDGILEAASPAGELFGEARLVAALRERRDAPLRELRDAVESALARHCAGAPARDDVSLLLIEVLP